MATRCSGGPRICNSDETDRYRITGSGCLFQKSQLIELASPDNFIPELPGWHERNLFIARHGQIDFYHYDPYGQTLAKIQRGHERDLRDARAMIRDHLVEVKRLQELFAQIEPQLLRYPAIEPTTFRVAVEEFCQSVARTE